MTHNADLIITISLIIIFAPFFAKLLKLPTTPIEIILGSIFGYLGFLQHHNLFKLVAEFGFLYLMFIAGTEIDMKQFLKIPAKMLRLTFVYIMLLYAIAAIFTL